MGFEAGIKTSNVDSVRKEQRIPNPTIGREKEKGRAWLKEEVNTRRPTGGRGFEYGVFLAQTGTLGRGCTYRYT